MSRARLGAGDEDLRFQKMVSAIAGVLVCLAAIGLYARLRPLAGFTYTHETLGTFGESDLIAIPGLVLLLWFNALLGSLRNDSSSPSAKVVVEATPRAADWVDEELRKPKMTVLYGSQTGTAEGYASNLTREAKQMGFRTKVEDLFDFDSSTLPEEGFVVFVVSTYGEGEATDSAKDFVEWLTDSGRMDGELKGLKYAVFGLGDTQYKHFCQAGKDVDRHLSNLGATAVCDLGTGDADQNMEEDFDTWKSSLWVQSAAQFGVKPRNPYASAPEQNLAIKKHDPPADASSVYPYVRVSSTSIAVSQKLPCWGTMLCNDEMLKERTVEGRSTRHIEIDLKGTGLAQETSYEGGDHLGVFPANDEAVVDVYMKALRLSEAQGKEMVSLVAADHSSGRNHLPTRVPVRMALKWFFDLQGPPKKAVLRSFSHYTADKQEQEELRELLAVNAEAAARYREEMAKLRTIGGFFQKYPSTVVPLSLFMELMPRIQPRWYSIASDPLWKQHTGTVHICLAITPGGLASEFLGKAKSGDLVPCFIRKSAFHLPHREKRRPVIMIGPGTGVAPLVGFLYRRKAWRERFHELGPCRFYFGCRSKIDDWLYEDLMGSCAKDKNITDLRVAFSRDSGKKVYVQHHLQEDAKDVWELLQKKAMIYVCGDAKRMARDVDNCLVAICQDHGGMSKEQAEKFLTEKEKRAEYLKDVWTS